MESRHAGAAIVLNPEGQAIERLGDTDAPILPRSSLKPIQALACLAAGAQLADETLQWSVTFSTLPGWTSGASSARPRGHPARRHEMPWSAPEESPSGFV